MAERVRRCEHIDDSGEVELANRRDYEEDNTQRTKVHASQSWRRAAGSTLASVFKASGDAIHLLV